MTITSTAPINQIGAELPNARPLVPKGQAARSAIDCVLIMLALLVPTAIAWALDERQLNGISVWIKPMHFQVSLAVHFATVVVLLRLLSPAGRDSRTVRWSMLAAVTAAVAEIGYIMVQAARGRHSHFNDQTPLEEALYTFMGIGAVTIVVGAFVLGVVIWRQSRTGIGAGLRLGTISGLLLGSLATLIVAGVLSSGLVAGPGHWVGGGNTDATGLPIMGWSTTGGDLRVSHFFATHAMQALPIFGCLADRMLAGSASRTISMATVAWAALVGATFVQAAMGIPLVRL